MNDERIIPIDQDVCCFECAFNGEWHTNAVVTVIMRTEENPRYMDLPLCGNHAEVALIPDEPLKK